MHTQLHGLTEDRFIDEVLHAPDLLRPNILKFNLDALKWQQEPVDCIVLLEHVRAEDQVEWPLAGVTEREA